MFLASALVSVPYALSNTDAKFNQSRYNITHHLINLEVIPEEKSISGFVETKLWALEGNLEEVYFDLHKNYTVSKAEFNGSDIVFEHTNDLVKLNLNGKIEKGSQGILRVYYAGKPPEAGNPPWDNGFVWSEDEEGKPWVGVTCQGLGPYVWFPAKNELSDEPDSVDLVITVPEGLFCASNGVLVSSTPTGKGKTRFHWKTKHPINNYNITINVGNFEAVRTAYKINMDLVYYVLPEERAGAENLLAEAAEMIGFYERHFGPYPYADEKFGLVQTKYWGMEHQTINSYGNHYKKTKLGYDFLMLHEMGHEWWGNLLSVDNWTDAWIHEGIGTYAEGLFIEEKYGYDQYLDFFKNKAGKHIRNKTPVVPEKPAEDGSFDSDIYYKGAYIIHTLRYLTDKETLLKILNESLYHPKTRKYNHITTEEWISIAEEISGKDLTWFFDAYLYHKELPVLEIDKVKSSKNTVYSISWDQKGFKMPLEVSWIDGKTEIKRERLELSDSPLRFSVSNDQKLIYDPDNWVLFELENQIR